MKLSNDEWMNVCFFMDLKSLLTFQLVSLDCYRNGSSDLIWKVHCDRAFDNYSKVQHDTSSGVCGHNSILALNQNPINNYKQHLMHLSELKQVKTIEKIEYHSYDKILNMTLSELDSRLTHMKVAVIGECSGVSSLLKRLQDGTNFDGSIAPQHRVNFTHEVSIENRKFWIEFTDISDMEYRRVMPLFMYGSDLIIPTFPLNDKPDISSTTANISKKKKKTEEKLDSRRIDYDQYDMVNPPIIILGTMLDLVKGKSDPNHNSEIIPSKKVLKLANQSHCLSYYEISTFTATDETMQQFAELCVKSVLLTHKPFQHQVQENPPTSKCLLQ